MIIVIIIVLVIIMIIIIIIIRGIFTGCGEPSLDTLQRAPLLLVFRYDRY